MHCHRGQFVGRMDDVGRIVAWWVCRWTDRQGTQRGLGRFLWCLSVFQCGLSEWTSAPSEQSSVKSGLELQIYSCDNWPVVREKIFNILFSKKLKCCNISASFGQVYYVYGNDSYALKKEKRKGNGSCRFQSSKLLMRLYQAYVTKRGYYSPT
jgi:hypothetical protein